MTKTPWMPIHTAPEFERPIQLYYGNGRYGVCVTSKIPSDATHWAPADATGIVAPHPEEYEDSPNVEPTPTRQALSLSGTVWQPIATVPDMRPILIMTDGVAAVTYNTASTWGVGRHPTHWAPLPTMPSWMPTSDHGEDDRYHPSQFTYDELCRALSDLRGLVAIAAIRSLPHPDLDLLVSDVRNLLEIFDARQVRYRHPVDRRDGASG